MAVDTDTGHHIPKDPNAFHFDSEVISIFDNMAERSIPGYSECVDYVRAWAGRVEWERGAQVWDFGSTTGAMLKAVKSGVGVNPWIDLIGVDISSASVEEIQKRYPWAKMYQHDMRKSLMPDHPSHGAIQMMIMGWTLQFIDFPHRAGLIKQAYENLAPGGSLFVFEKYKLDDEHAETLCSDLYYQWRRQNGYSLHEILSKLKALSGTMSPHSPAYAMDMLLGAGFDQSDIRPVYQKWNFGGLVATKRNDT